MLAAVLLAVAVLAGAWVLRARARQRADGDYAEVHALERARAVTSSTALRSRS